MLTVFSANQVLPLVSLFAMKYSRPKNKHNYPKAIEQESPVELNTRSFDRKAMQLCAQVRHALEYAISEALNGEFGVTVLEVIPAPNTSHLLALVQPLEDLSFEESMNLQAELNKRINVLRTAVSESIHRRKTPGLSFQLVPRPT